jgi:hypothetical protein
MTNQIWIPKSQIVAMDALEAATLERSASRSMRWVSPSPACLGPPRC